MIPEKFLEEMKKQMPDSWEELLACYQEPPCHGYRWNVTKLTKAGVSFFDDEPVSWCANGRYQSRQGMGKHPLYYAGAYYIQEPSAMLPAAMLEAQPGDRVLDLCAAPGGKSTQLLDDMRDTGLLVANDISASRGKAIVRNLERFGFRNFLVTSESPEKLASCFPEYYDRILVDAPCSGEGMFRREPDMGQEWEEKGPSYYMPVQREILSYAAAMLRPGGRLVYSTCTFSCEEDEHNARWLTEQFPELELVCQRKLMPHQVKGEGQYAACFKKKQHSESCGRSDRLMRESFQGQTGKPLFDLNRDKGGKDSLSDFLKLIDTGALGWNLDFLYRREDQLYLLPVPLEPYRSLRFLRTGLLLGKWKKERFEPGQALAMSLTENEFRNTVNFPPEDERVIRYLKGETVDCAGADSKGKDGWCLILMAGLPLGFAKRTGTTLKNKYDAGWRML